MRSHDYAAGFGDQWAQHRTTQLDSHTGTSVTRDRFEAITGWRRHDLVGASTLDAGSGAGRFSEVAVSLGAKLTTLDLSTAAYATRKTLSGADATVVRGDLLQPPLRRASFEKAFSIGVLQHTPDPPRAAQRLLALLVPGGELVIWMYERRWWTRLQPKHLIRPITRRLPTAVVTALVDVLVFMFTPAARVAPHLPDRFGKVVRAALPIASYWGILPLEAHQQVEWSRLDTRDWLTPTYDKPMRYEELRAVLLAGGATDVRRLPVPGLAVGARVAGLEH